MRGIGDARTTSALPGSGRPEFIRPNGRVYRPRRSGLWAHAWEDSSGGWAFTRGVIVFGTLDPERALTFARECSAYWHEVAEVCDPRPGWYRDGMRFGERAWIDDERRGAPGVHFRTKDEE